MPVRAIQTISRPPLCTYTFHVSQNEWNSLGNSDVSNTSTSLSLDTEKSREEYSGLSCRYHAFIDVYLIARGASYPAPQKYDRSPVVEPIIIPPGFERERDGRGESGLHCYYNETRINTSRLYTRDRCNYLLMMIFVAVGGRGAPRMGEGLVVASSSRRRRRHSSLGPPTNYQKL